MGLKKSKNDGRTFGLGVDLETRRPSENQRCQPTELYDGSGRGKKSDMALPGRVRKAIERLLGSAGTSEPALRHAVFERARTGMKQAPATGPCAPELVEFVEKIEERPWTVGAEDFAKLRLAGYSEDQLFELTLAAATGAGVRRFEAGVRALEAAGPEKP